MQEEIMHYFERLERVIDFSREYSKLEEMLLCEEYPGQGFEYLTINAWVEENFREWEKEVIILLFLKFEIN